MLQVTESKVNGLCFSVEATNITQIEILDALLSSVGVMFVKSQQNQWSVQFKIDVAEAGKVKTMIQGWCTSIGDIQYGMDTRQYS